MSSKMDFQKKCKWCDAIFTAHKTTTNYCSHKCASLAYKDRVRKERVASLQIEFKRLKRIPTWKKRFSPLPKFLFCLE